MSKKLSGFIAIAFFMFAMAATTKAQMYTAYLSGAQEVPANASTARGYARVFINPTALTVRYTVVFSGLGSNHTAWHIHAPGARGATGPVTIDFGAASGTTSGSVTTTTAITQTQINNIRSGLAYVNVHSTGFPGGEIRGQLALRRVVDFDGDGRTDLSVLKFPAVPKGEPAPITYWNQNSTNGLQVVGPFGDANTGDFPAPGDYDGDGIDDIAIYRAGGGGSPSAFWILFSSTNVPQYYNWGIEGDQSVARDYDGDGITDVAVFRRGASIGSQAFWYIRQSSNNTARIVPFGTTGDVAGGTSADVPVPADYDGDGKFDLAVYRFNIAPANNFIVQRSSDNVVTFTPFGDFNTDYIAPGDFDGDGKADYVAARTGATAGIPMVWWILQSSNGQVRVRQFGLSADRVTQGDYDGDGITDISVFRLGATTGASNFFWTVNSSNSAITSIPWGVRGDFPTATFDAR